MLSPPATFNQKSCASPTAVEPHDIALARRADIKRSQVLVLKIPIQEQPCTFYISPQLTPHSSGPPRRQDAGPEIFPSTTCSAGEAKSRTHGIRPLSISSLQTYQGGRNHLRLTDRSAPLCMLLPCKARRHSGADSESISKRRM